MPELITISPIDGSEVARRAYADEHHIAATLRRAKIAQRDWRQVSLVERMAVLSRAVDAFSANKDAIADAISRQIGRPIRYTPNEVVGFDTRARHMMAIAPEALADIRPAPIEGFNRFIRREALGVVLVVAPWNYPLLTAVNAIIPALMAGNTVILKHSAQTPLCAEQIHAAFVAAGLPAGVFQYLHTDHTSTQKLIQAKEIKHVCFTGSVAGGIAVEQAAAGRFIGLGLELGGNDAALVRSDADLAHAVDTLVDGAFFNSGQSCCGTQRIYVHQSVYQEFVDRALALTEQYVLGNPLEAATTLGPVVRVAAANAVRAVEADALAKGASQIVDTRRFALDDGKGAYLAPRIFTGVNHQMQLMADECFGPVVGIMPVKNDEEAIRLMNDSPYGLTSAVFSRDENVALSLGDQLECGTFFMNRCDYLDPALPWTGIKQTGRGATLSVLGYDYLTRPKSFHLKQM
jgi:acyl-CoA reductase-like NAD-dependent aldehyde dehydrogenase